jgi:hypothetical protein
LVAFTINIAESNFRHTQRPERNRTARSFRQLRRFHHVINSDKVFGTHTWLEQQFDDAADEAVRSLGTL